MVYCAVQTFKSSMNNLENSKLTLVLEILSWNNIEVYSEEQWVDELQAALVWQLYSANSKNAHIYLPCSLQLAIP